MSKYGYRSGVIESAAEVIAHSVLGAPIELYASETTSIQRLIISGHHGEEPECTVLLSRALRSLSEPLQNCAVILGVNPDGMQRGTRGNARGVDLNRNFPTKNWTAEAVKHRWFYYERAGSIELSPGSCPGSEPETKALLKVCERYAPKEIISIHGDLSCVDVKKPTTTASWLSRCSTISYRFFISSLEHILSIFNREILKISLIFLRFRSIR